MRKRSSYRPQGANPQAWIVAMQGASLLSKGDQASRAMKVHLAVDSIRRGEASTDDWRQVFDALNMVEAFSGMPSVMQGAAEFVQHQQETIVSILDRQKATGSKALRADEITALMELDSLWAEVLGTVTHAEYFKAEQVVRRRVMNALRQPGVHVVEAV